MQCTRSLSKHLREEDDPKPGDAMRLALLLRKYPMVQYISPIAVDMMALKARGADKVKIRCFASRPALDAFTPINERKGVYVFHLDRASPPYIANTLKHFLPDDCFVSTFHFPTEAYRVLPSREVLRYADPERMWEQKLEEAFELPAEVKALVEDARELLEMGFVLDVLRYETPNPFTKKKVLIYDVFNA